MLRMSTFATLSKEWIQERYGPEAFGLDEGHKAGEPKKRQFSLMEKL
jgi:hypothetical protein